MSISVKPAMSKAAIIQPSLILRERLSWYIKRMRVGDTIANAHALYTSVNTWCTHSTCAVCSTKPQGHMLAAVCNS